jgi:hypothetical protein
MLHSNIWLLFNKYSAPGEGCNSAVQRSAYFGKNVAVHDVSFNIDTWVAKNFPSSAEPDIFFVFAKNLYWAAGNLHHL